MAFIIFSKRDGETRIKNALGWLVAAISLPWLFWVWQSVKSPNENRAFWWAIAIYLPLWAVLVGLENDKKKHRRASNILASFIIVPWAVYAFSDILKIYSEWFASRNVELIIYAAGFGVFWILGLRVRDFEINLHLLEQR
jgi:hypothetical protein